MKRIILNRDKLIKILFVYALALVASIAASAHSPSHLAGAESPAQHSPSSDR